MAIEHVDIDLAEIHIPYNWSYADATARAAATGFVAGEVGKLARQLDDNTLWMLTDDSPATWVQVGGAGIGGPPTGAAGGALAGTYPNPDLASAVAGSGLGFSSNVLSVNVDGSTLEINSDTVRQKDAGTTNAKLANMANATVKGRNTAGTGVPEDVTMAQLYALLKSQIPCEICIACSDETTAITTGTAKATFRMPYAMTVTAVRVSLTTVSSSGIPTFDINESGTTILSTKLTVDASEKTSTTAATAAVISDSALADDAEMTIDFDVAGTGATGVKIWLLGVRA